MNDHCHGAFVAAAYLESLINDSITDDVSSDSSDASSQASSTYEGVAELFDAAERREREDEVRRKAEQIQNFKLKVLELFEDKKELIHRRIKHALDLHGTLEDLLQNQVEAPDMEKASSIKNLVDEICSGGHMLNSAEMDKLSSDLDDIAANVTILRELTSVRSEDEVMCSVCLTCPGGVIWDCIRCDHLTCDFCRWRLSSCPTCKVTFRKHPPRRNRWAEKLAKLQREKVYEAAEDEE